MGLAGRIGILFFLVGHLLLGEIFLEADTYKVGVGESLNLRVTITGKKEKNYQIEDIENFKEIGHYTSTSHSLINGRKNSTYVDNYRVIAMKEGRYSLKVRGSRGESNSVDIEVVDQLEKPAEERRYFIKSGPDRKDYYFGEKIPYIETLVTTVSLQDIDYLQSPDFGDISVVDIGPGRIGSQQRKTRVGDREALEILLYQGILEPASSGKKKIGSSIVRLVIEGNTFFNNQVADIAGRGREINILPLPGNIPKNFKNIVGKIEGTVEVDRNSVGVGEAVTMTVSLSGQGGLEGLNSLIDGRNRDFNIYEDIIEKGEWLEGESYMNRKTFQLAFIPKHSGILKTPVIEVPYFDTEKESYKTFVIESREIDVAEEPGGILLPGSVHDGREEIEDVEISLLPERVEEEKKTSPLLMGILFLVIAQGGVITYLLRDRFKLSKRKDILRDMKKSKSDKEFYDKYCTFMKKRYGFNPRAHSIETLRGGAGVREIHKEIEEKIFKRENLDRRRIVKRLSKEID